MDWPDYAAAIRQAVSNGATFILTGEDVGIDPATGLATWPHHDGKQLEALCAALRGAAWSPATPDGETIAATLGKGKVILCRESIDAAGNTNAEAAQWQARWREQLAGGEQNITLLTTAIPAPDAQKLLRWWAGLEPMTAMPRVVTWFGGNQREVKLALDPDKHLGEVFLLVLPPTGEVKSLDFTITGNGAGPVRFDVGCRDATDGEMATLPAAATSAATATTVPWRDAVTRYLAWRTTENSAAFRDDNHWRLVPVRVTAGGKVTLKLSGLRMVVQ